MKTNHTRMLARLMGPVALGGVAWSLAAERPLQAQNTGLAEPPKMEQPSGPGREQGPRESAPRGEAGGEERSGRRSGAARGPRAGGRNERSRDERSREERGGDDRDDNYGPPRGPGGGFGPPPGGPDGMRGPGGEFGPPPPGHFGPPPGGFGPRDEMGFGGPPGRGPGGFGGPGRPEAGGGRGPGGPGERGPRGRGGEIGRAAHAIADVDVFDNLTGDAYNVSGQAREYFRRALNARKSGQTEDAGKYALVAGELARAAVCLAEVQTGRKLPELLGAPGFDGEFGGPGPRNERPKPDSARLKEHAGHVLNDAYRMLGETRGQWNETARKLYSQARTSYDAGKYDQAIGQGCAVLHLTQAGSLN